MLTDRLNLIIVATESNLLQAVCVFIGRFDSRMGDFSGTLSVFTGDAPMVYLPEVETRKRTADIQSPREPANSLHVVSKMSGPVVPGEERCDSATEATRCR
jgi:hypothetical protein